MDLSLICRHENVPENLWSAIWSRLRPVNFFSFLATDDPWHLVFFVWVRSIATEQNDRYLVLTCRRAFAMVLLVFLGFFHDCFSCLGQRIKLLPGSSVKVIVNTRTGGVFTTVWKR